MTVKSFFIIDTTVSDKNLVNVDEIWEHVMECIPSIKSVSLKTENGSYGRLVPNLTNQTYFSCEIPVEEVPDDPITIENLISCVKSYFQDKQVYIGADISVRAMIQDGQKIRIYCL
jgi:hypothetical protein